MGDTVQRLTEDMVPELEDFKKRGLFNAEEIKSIVKTRTDFEYKLQRRVPLLADYMNAIQYEMNLELLRKKRRVRLGQQRRQATVSDFSIVRRTHFIFERATRKFSNDLRLWSQYIDWSISNNSAKRLAIVLPRALQLHPLCPALWIKAAQWEFESNRNVNTARVMFQRSLRMNPDSKLLWWLFFQMEMKYIGRILQRKRTLGLILPNFSPSGAASTLRIIPDDGDDGSVSDDESTASATQKHGKTTIDDNDKVFLSGALPLAIFKNAIKSKGLEKDFSFRIGFIAHVQSWKVAVHLDSKARRRQQEKKKLKKITEETLAEGLSKEVDEEVFEDRDTANDALMFSEGAQSVEDDEVDSLEQQLRAVGIDFTNIIAFILGTCVKDFPDDAGCVDAIARCGVPLSFPFPSPAEDAKDPDKTKKQNNKKKNNDINKIHDDTLGMVDRGVMVFEHALKRINTCSIYLNYARYLLDRRGAVAGAASASASTSTSVSASRGTATKKLSKMDEIEKASLYTSHFLSVCDAALAANKVNSALAFLWVSDLLADGHIIGASKLLRTLLFKRNKEKERQPSLQQSSSSANENDDENVEVWRFYDLWEMLLSLHSQSLQVQISTEERASEYHVQKKGDDDLDPGPTRLGKRKNAESTPATKKKPKVSAGGIDHVSSAVRFAKLVDLHKTAIASVRAMDAFRAWNGILDLHLSVFSNAKSSSSLNVSWDIVNTCFHHGVESKCENGLTIKTKYILWISDCVASLESARAAMAFSPRVAKAVDVVLAFSPLSPELFALCVAVEKQVQIVSASPVTALVKRLSHIFEMEISRFGANHADIWLLYMQTIQELEGAKGAQVVTSLYWRALKVLDGAEHAAFIAAYDRMR